jgi:hypothetical protein
MQISRTALYIDAAIHLPWPAALRTRELPYGATPLIYQTANVLSSNATHAARLFCTAPQTTVTEKIATGFWRFNQGAAVTFWRFRCLDCRHGSVESGIMTLTTCNHGQGWRALLPTTHVNKGRLEVWSAASSAQVCTCFHADYRGPADSSLKSYSYCTLASSRFHVD